MAVTLDKTRLGIMRPATGMGQLVGAHGRAIAFVAIGDEGAGKAVEQAYRYSRTA